MTLEEKVDFLTKVVIEHCPISRMALIYNLDPNQVENIYQIFDKYFKKCEKNEDFTFMDVENDFRPMGIDYQSLKGIISAFYEAGKYEGVIWQYLYTNYKIYGNVSSEYINIFNTLHSKFNHD